MSTIEPNTLAETHEATNQPSALENYNVYRADRALVEAVHREGGAAADAALEQFGALCGSREIIEWGYQANENPPTFRSHNRYGQRSDEVSYHPAYHQLMQQAIGHELHCLPWSSPGPAAHVHRAALFYLQTQVEAGHGCPISMTFAAHPTLEKQPDIAAQWLPRVNSSEYDPRNTAVTHKRGATVGMAMTEKQGGSDVRANTTRAHPMGQRGGGQLYELVGHKYFVSAPMSDAFLVLAQAADGLSCFLVPRWRPDGSKNPLQLQQLKRKMGNMSNASSETELRGALGWLIGDEGRGVANILEMVALTRYDCVIGSAAGMRQAVAQAVHHCSERSAFGNKLVDQPLMQNVLADIVLESEAATALTMRLGRALDNPGDEHESRLLRIATVLGKYWVCKRSPQLAYEAMECLGGMGVMDDCILPRLYREAPINAIWEGSGNVQCLDLLRVMGRNPDSVEALFSELRGVLGQSAHYDAHLQQLQNDLADPGQLDYRARNLVERAALSLQASVLLRAGNELVAQSFCTARLAPGRGQLYGNLPPGIDCAALIARARPV